VAACPYADSDDTAGESENSGSNCSYVASSCSGGGCSSCTEASSSSPDAYGAFRCESGECETRVCEDGSCDTNVYAGTSARNATGAVICEDGTCQGKVCEGEDCETGSFSLSGISLKSWFDSLFGSSDIAPEETTVPASSCETATPAATVTTGSTNFYGNFAEDTEPVAVEDTTPVEEVVVPSCEVEIPVVESCEVEAPASGVADYDTVYAALKVDKTERNSLTASYTSLNFAQDVCAAMTKQGIDCQIGKVTFTDGKVSYFNSFQTGQGVLNVDSCGTASGTGIKKVINTLEVGKQWKSTSLFKQCILPYDKGTVATIEYL
jgi:hypothetical protein